MSESSTLSSELRQVRARISTRIETIEGIPRILINDALVDALAFRSFVPEPGNVTDFHEAGVRLMNILVSGQKTTIGAPYSEYGDIWIGKGEYDFEPFERQIQMFMEHAPDAVFNIMLHLDTKDWLLTETPGLANTFQHLDEAGGHPVWRKEVARFIRDAIAYMEEHYGDRIFAYSLLAGKATEWFTNCFWRQDNVVRYDDVRITPEKLAAFREFSGNPAVEIPPVETLFTPSGGTFRDPELDKASLAYWHYHHGIVADAILHCAGVAKATVQRDKLVGVFFGYCNSLQGSLLMQCGHLAYEKVWDSPDIDMIYCPARYKQARTFEGNSGFQLAVDSLRLKNKVYFHEVDHTTYVAPQTLPSGAPIPGSDAKPKSDFESLMILRREFAMASAKQLGLWWFDFFGGYYASEVLMKEVAAMVGITERLQSIRMQSTTQIAVLEDPLSMLYVDSAARLNDDLLIETTNRLSAVGAPFDTYSLNDITAGHFPAECYRLIIFLNCFHIQEETRRAIEEKFKTDGRTLLWLYAPGYVGDMSLDTKGISDLVDMRVERAECRYPRATFLERSGLPGLAGVEGTFSGEVSTLFQIIDLQASTLAHYQNGEIAAAYKKMVSYTSVYCAVDCLPASFYRAVAQYAGVHLYGLGTNPIYANDRLLGTHIHNPEDRSILLPNKGYTQAEDLFDGGTLPIEQGRLLLPDEPGACKLYLLHT